MDHSLKIKTLQQKIATLKGLREVAYKLCDAVCQIEKEVSAVDEALPNPEFIESIDDAEEREQIAQAELLLQEAYNLVDEMLGPPDEVGADGHAAGYEAALSGDGKTVLGADGGSTVNFDDLMKYFPTGGKGDAS